MAWWVILGYVLFGALAVGWRIVRQYRRTGSTGFRGLSGRPGSVEWLGGALFVVSIVFGVLAPICDLAGMLSPLAILAATPFRVVGTAAYSIGLAGTVWAQLAMGDSWRIGVDESERTRMIVRGPFAHVRNPIFTFMIVCIGGLALLLPNLLSLAAVGTLVTAVELHVRAVEEPYLARTHGEAYRRYVAVVGRFLPGIGRR